MIAAWRAASRGARVVLLEKTPRLGTKVLISGGGKCNVTHDGPLEELLRAFRPNEARFIRPACYRFTNQQVVDLMTERGLRVYTRPDGRIFPVDQTAKDVVAILRSLLEESGVDVRMNTPVEGLATKGSQMVGVVSGGETLATNHVVLAVGGSSYPASGTTGDGFRWAKQVGHTLVPVIAALAPIEMASAFAELAGVALRDCVLKARLQGKEYVRWQGDLLFTHRGVSGPTVLGISREVAERRMGDLEVDLMPEESFERLGARLAEAIRTHPKRQIATHLEAELPDRIVPFLLEAAGIDDTESGASLTQRARNRLVEVLKGWRLGSVREVVLDKGEVVAGGIALDEVDPQTMRSKIVQGLYLCGEVLDVAGPVGGYNLQAAFSTGYVAGETAAADWASRTASN